MSLTAGAKLGPYLILSTLGAGGMGEVYRARDGKLDRDVALKVLPHQRAADPERRKRLLREARAASALNHPNICTVYEIGSHDDQDYIAFEYVQGQTLQTLADQGRLSMESLLDLALPLAEALVYAGVLVLNDRKDQADVLLDALPSSTPPTHWDALGIALRSGLRSQPEAVQEAVTPTVKAAIASHEQYSWHAARFFALAGLKQDALDSLQNAIRLGFINYPFLSQHDPFLKNIRQEKRFKELMEEVRSQWERFEV